MSSKFKDYFLGLSEQEKGALADACSMSYYSLQNLAYGQRGASPLSATQIELATKGVVTRKDFFPDTWQKIWPELAQ